MKRLSVYIIPIVFLLLAACSADPIAVTPVMDEINFSTGVVATRGIIESDGNDIPQQAMNNIQLIRGTDGSSQQGFVTSLITSVASIAGGSGTMNLATPQYFYDFINDAHFMAFYPEPNSYDAGKASWTIDGTQDIMVTAPVTAPFTRGGTTVAFQFNHCLAQVVFKMVAVDTSAVDLFGNLLSAKINVPAQLDLTIADNGVASLGKKNNSSKIDLDFGAMTLKTDTVTSKGILIYPDVTDLTHINLEFEKRNALDYSIENLVLAPGYKTLIVATVYGKAIKFNVSLVGWKNATETAGQDDEIGLGRPGESLK